MTVKGNVISCDCCGQQLMVPVASKHASKQDTDELARAHAAGWGWGNTVGGDYCLAHVREALAPDLLEQHPSANNRGMILRALLGARRRRDPYGVVSTFSARNAQRA